MSNQLPIKIVETLEPGVDEYDASGEHGEGVGVSLVIPVFNESESLLPLYDKIKEAMETLGRPWEAIFIDDGSQDDSFQILASLNQEDSRVKVIRLRRNMGQTAALSAGFDYSSGQVIVTLDADLQNDPADIPRLLAKLDEGHDIVSGWRKSRQDKFLTKKLPSKMSNKLVSRLTGVHLNDYGCTLKAYRREVIKELRLYGELHRYIPAVASSIGVSVAEIEVSHHARSFGQSKYGGGRLIRGLLDVVALKLLLSYMTRPMQIFGPLGIISLGIGILAGFLTLAMKVFGDFNITGNPILYIAILSEIVGIQFISLGFLGEISIRTYHESQDKPIYVVREVLDGNGDGPTGVGESRHLTAMWRNG